MTFLYSTPIPTEGRPEIAPGNFAISPAGDGGIAWSSAADGARAGAAPEVMAFAAIPSPGAGESAGERTGSFSGIVSAPHQNAWSALAASGEPSPRDGRVDPVGPGEPDGGV